MTPTTPDRGVEIEFRDVSHQYTSEAGGFTTALGRTDLSIDMGDLVCVVGPSGCGKTTMLKMIAGFLRPSSGEVRVAGIPVTGPQARCGVVFQRPTLYPWYSIRENVELALRFQGVSKTERRERAAHFLDLVGLSDFHRAKPYELSGGMQQRAQIARVLTSDPEVILMDEPFGALDAMTREKLQLDLLTIQQDQEKTIFFITHSVDEAVFLGNRVLVMSPRPGRIIKDVRVDLASVVGRFPGADMRKIPEFQTLRNEIAQALGTV